MTHVISALVFNDTKQAENRVAMEILNAETTEDWHWQISINGTDNNGDTVEPHFIAIDNYGNGGDMVVTIDNISTEIPSYTSVEFGLSPFTSNVDILGFVGTILVYLSEQKLPLNTGSDQSRIGEVSGFLRRDGAEPMVGDLDMGGHSLVNLAGFNTVDSISKLVPSQNARIFLTSAGREGDFLFSNANLTTQVAKDDSTGIYIAPSSDDTGASGAWVRKFNGPARLKWFGAVGDGITDDTTAILNAINICSYLNIPLSGDGLVYGVTGLISCKFQTWLEDMQLKQLAPAASVNVGTILNNGASRVILKRVSVNKNGDGSNGGLAAGQGSNGCMNTARAILVNGGQFSQYEDLEVFGNDTGTGIMFENMDNTNKVIRPFVHDMAGINANGTDENICGINFQNCDGLTVSFPIVKNLTFSLDGVSYTNNQTRGIGIGGCEFLTIAHPQIGFCNEGIDISGSPQLNIGVTVNSGSVSDIYTWGVKCADFTKQCRICNVQMIRCSGAGGVDSSCFDTEQLLNDANVFENCVARDCGDLSHYSQASGFAALVGVNHIWTNGVVFRNCVAVDERVPTQMKYGFHNEKVARPTCLTSYQNCQSIGHTNSPFNGEHEDRCHISLNLAAQVIPNNVTTALAFDTTLEDTCGMYNHATDPTVITILRDGVYNLFANVLWTVNGVGFRFVQFTKNGVSFSGGQSNIPGNSAGNHAQNYSWLTERLKAGDKIGIGVQQNSGGNLNIIASTNQTQFLVQRLTS